MALTPLPTPPSRNDPVNFSSRADAFLQAMQTLVDEFNAGAPGESAFALAQSLADTGASKGTKIVGHIDSGSGALEVTAEDKLRAFAVRSEYPDDATFNAARGSRPNIDGSGNWNAKVTPPGEQQGNLADKLLAFAAGPRDAVMYDSATSVRVFRHHVVMGGFRFRGHYSRGRAPVFAMPSSQVASLTTGLGAESSACLENWYAVFACADSGDAAATLKVMPYLRAGAVSGSNVPLIKGGERQHSGTSQTYAWGSANNLTGTDCLVIHEGGIFSGRTTTITANSAGQVTLAAIGSVAAGDFLLPAPPGFDHYCYLGSCYLDTAEVRNIADAGVVVKSKMVNINDPNFTTTGAISSAVEIHMGGYICPLATAVVLKDTHTISTASTGDHAGYFWTDSSMHEVQQNYEAKTSSANLVAVWDGIELPFSQRQSIWYLTGGSRAASRADATLEVKGWIEP